MQRTPVTLSRDCIPEGFHCFFEDAAVYNSSCSPAARVWFFDKGPGFYLKCAPKGSLEKEAAMTRFFHSKALGPEVLAYESLEEDWLLTRRVVGEDCIWQPYLEDPLRLCKTTAQLLRMLHETPFPGCPVNRTRDYLATALENYQKGAYDLHLFSDKWHFTSAEEAWRIVEACGSQLQADTLIHGDYCLPNIILDNWNFSGFIDLDTAGVGDRHVDLFWGMWTLQFNLKTDRYADRFLDAYGREAVCNELFPVIAAAEVFG